MRKTSARSTSDTDSDWFHAAKAAMATSNELQPDASAALLGRHYGWISTIDTLSSEAEHTARLEVPDGTALILKTSSRREAQESFRFQAMALAGLAGAPGFVVPRVVPTLAGELCFEDGDLSGYVQTCIDGHPIGSDDTGPDRLHAAGRALGALDAALAPITIPGERRPVLWNIGCWPGLLEFAGFVPPGAIADAVQEAMARYIEDVQPLLPALTWQVTHNDPSPSNMFAVGSGIGFIDFGDGGWAPRIQDLAIAASHFVLDPSHALGGAEPLIAGYASVLPLSALEAKLLVGLIRARQAALILVNAWRAALFPANAAYITKNVARAERGLSILRPLDAAGAEATVLAAVRWGPMDPYRAIRSPKGNSHVC